MSTYIYIRIKKTIEIKVGELYSKIVIMESAKSIESNFFMNQMLQKL